MSASEKLAKMSVWEDFLVCGPQLSQEDKPHNFATLVKYKHDFNCINFMSEYYDFIFCSIIISFLECLYREKGVVYILKLKIK